MFSTAKPETAPHAPNWLLRFLVLGFLLVPALPVGLGAAAVWLSGRFPADPNTAFERSIVQAAVRKPGSDPKLVSFADPKQEIEFVSFGFLPLAAEGGKITKSHWVATPEQLRGACRRDGGDVRNLEQVLGLAPAQTPRMVQSVKVAAREIFRPCLSGHGVEAERCGFALVAAIDVNMPPASENADEKLKRHLHYEQLRFVAQQVLKAHRTGFQNPHAIPGDYPHDGAPFTGMGWTYNWNPAAASPVGVSEFIIPQGAPVTLGPRRSAEAFCQERPPA